MKRESAYSPGHSFQPRRQGQRPESHVAEARQVNYPGLPFRSVRTRPVYRSPRLRLRRVRRSAVGVCVAALLPVAGIGVSAASEVGESRGAPQVGSVRPCRGTGTPPRTWSHITLVMFENKPVTKVIGNQADAPYLNSIASRCSYSQNTEALGAPSLRNYIGLTSGYRGCEKADAAGVCTVLKPVTSNGDPTQWPQASRSIFELMNTRNVARADSALQWAEDMPQNCYLQKTSKFMVQHAPYQYYTRARASCQTFARPFPARRAAVLSGRFNLVVPNKVHSMHRPFATASQQIQDGDAWLARYLPSVLDSRRYRGGKSAILISWDEGNAQSGTVPLIVISPYTSVGGVSSVPYNHYSTLKGIQMMLGQTDALLGRAGAPKTASIRGDDVFRLK